MRAVIQRVSGAQVEVDGVPVASIGKGILALIGIGRNDSEEDVFTIAERLPRLRIFSDEQGKMNLDLLQVNGSLLLVPNFTLYGDARKGRRPNFMGSAGYEEGKWLFDLLVERLGEQLPVATGVYGASMQVKLTNDGPVTLLLDSDRIF